jgi:hypothetical protein
MFWEVAWSVGVTWVVVQLVLLWLLVDLLSGVLHWAEDRYWAMETPLLGETIRKNILHHYRPRHITRISFLACVGPTVAVNLGILAVLLMTVGLRWQVVAFIGMGMSVNAVHRWAHSTPSELNVVIRSLQRVRLIQTPAHHAKHHGLPRLTHYCAFTNVLNPVLDHLQAWRRAERLIHLLTGVSPRIDESLPGHGPTPEWVKDIDRRYRVSRSDW